MNPAEGPSHCGNIRVYWLAFIVYWGVILFGYDTGVAGAYFQKHFGLTNPDGTKNVKRTNEVSSNVVSVLQAGAFFGALGSAPISAKIGRKRTSVVFILIFIIGAILTTVADSPHNGLALIYAGRVISGVGIGAISAVAPAYVSECSPKGIMVAIGVMISYFLNYGVSQHLKEGANLWRISFGFQLVPAGIMLFGLYTVKESPHWLASVGHSKEALANLVYLRKDVIDSDDVVHELVEIETAMEEERDARQGLGLKEAFFGKGNFIPFVIAFSIFLLQQWGGQNSISYYAPQIFASIGYIGTKNSLLASGIYGVVKVVATASFVFFLVESLGRKISLLVSSLGMGTLFFIIGAILKTHPSPSTSSNVAAPNPPPASKAMAAMLYIYVCFYSMGWGPLPWVYASDIFPTRTRHYGLALASASQWLWNYVVAKITPDIISGLGYKIFFMFGTINIAGMAVFSLLIPETKGRSLEDMDIVFGTITAEQRRSDIERHEHAIHREKMTWRRCNPSTIEKV